jgi:hypothetical protein
MRPTWMQRVARRANDRQPKGKGAVHTKRVADQPLSIRDRSAATKQPESASGGESEKVQAQKVRPGGFEPPTCGLRVRLFHVQGRLLASVTWAYFQSPSKGWPQIQGVSPG